MFIWLSCGSGADTFIAFSIGLLLNCSRCVWRHASTLVSLSSVIEYFPIEHTFAHLLLAQPNLIVSHNCIYESEAHWKLETLALHKILDDFVYLKESRATKIKAINAQTDDESNNSSRNVTLTAKVIPHAISRWERCSTSRNIGEKNTPKAFRVQL